MKFLSTQRKGKKQILLLLPILVVLALIGAACNHSDDSSTATTAAGSGITTTTVAPVKVGLVYDIGGRGDQSFNDSAFAGIDKAKNELGIVYNEVSPNNDGSNRADLIKLQSESQNLVIGVGFLFGDSILNAAKNNPTVNYGIIDGGPSDQSPSNLAHLVFAEHEGSYLVGVAAAKTTTSKKVGFIGGVSIPLIGKFEAGFIAGVKATDASIEVTVEYISNPPDFAGFNDPAGAKVIANKLFSDGNDVVYHAAGGSGQGLFEAAQEYRAEMGVTVWAIGVDSDQYNAVDAELKPVILTSMLKRVDTAVFSISRDVVNGTFAGGPTPVVYDLSVDGVGYSTSGGFLSSTTITAIEAAKSAIIAGSITVPSAP